MEEQAIAAAAAAGGKWIPAAGAPVNQLDAIGGVGPKIS
jgi:predicted flap endonuclease-1-like 5' DNA nuclease